MLAWKFGSHTMTRREAFPTPLQLKMRYIEGFAVTGKAVTLDHSPGITCYQTMEELL